MSLAVRTPRIRSRLSRSLEYKARQNSIGHGFGSFIYSLKIAPAFAISDRDKGLIPAMQVKAGDIPHFVCAGHAQKKVQRQFLNATLKDQAWNLAKSLTDESFKRRASELKKHNAKACNGYSMQRSSNGLPRIVNVRALGP